MQKIKETQENMDKVWIVEHGQLPKVYMNPDEMMLDNDVITQKIKQKEAELAKLKAEKEKQKAKQAEKKAKTQHRVEEDRKAQKERQKH